MFQPFVANVSECCFGMRTALDIPAESLDSGEKTFVDRVRDHGWMRTGIFADTEGPAFSFTTGFWLTTRHPEIIIFGLGDEIMHDVLWDLFRDAKAGRDLPLGVWTSNVFGNSEAYVFPVAKRLYADYLGWSRWFYAGDDFPCSQVVWSDPAGTFPWDSGFHPSYANSQLDLTERGWLASLVD